MVSTSYQGIDRSIAEAVEAPYPLGETTRPFSAPVQAALTDLLIEWRKRERAFFADQTTDSLQKTIGRSLNAYLASLDGESPQAMARLTDEAALRTGGTALEREIQQLTTHIARAILPPGQKGMAAQISQSLMPAAQSALHKAAVEETEAALPRNAPSSGPAGDSPPATAFAEHVTEALGKPFRFPGPDGERSHPLSPAIRTALAQALIATEQAAPEMFATADAARLHTQLQAGIERIMHQSTSGVSGVNKANNILNHQIYNFTGVWDRKPDDSISAKEDDQILSAVLGVQLLHRHVLAAHHMDPAQAVTQYEEHAPLIRRTIRAVLSGTQVPLAALPGEEPVSAPAEATPPSAYVAFAEHTPNESDQKDSAPASVPNAAVSAEPVTAINDATVGDREDAQIASPPAKAQKESIELAIPAVMIVAENPAIASPTSLSNEVVPEKPEAASPVEEPEKPKPIQEPKPEPAEKPVETPTEITSPPKPGKAEPESENPSVPSHPAEQPSPHPVEKPLPKASQAGSWAALVGGVGVGAASLAAKSKPAAPGEKSSGPSFAKITGIVLGAALVGYAAYRFLQPGKGASR